MDTVVLFLVVFYKGNLTSCILGNLKNVEVTMLLSKEESPNRENLVSQSFMDTLLVGRNLSVLFFLLVYIFWQQSNLT